MFISSENLIIILYLILFIALFSIFNFSLVLYSTPFKKSTHENIYIYIHTYYMYTQHVRSEMLFKS